MILAIAVIGSYSVSNSLFDVWSCFGFAVLGWLLRRNGYPAAPVVLGPILGFLAETSFRRALMMDDWTIFFTRPVSPIMLVLAGLSFFYSLIKQRRARRVMVEPQT